MSDARTQSVADLLSLEATLVDERRWEEWLELFAEDVEYWAPAWDSETEFTQDPNAEMSLIHYAGRFGLEDRVYRLQSGNSTASTPPPRTCHMVTNILARFLPDGTSDVRASWQSNVYRFQTTTIFYGSYKYLLVPKGSSWLIKKKRILVLNDLIPSTLDIYSI